MSPETSVDVLVIGAGPAGLMAAFNLAQAGLNVRIIDQKSSRLLKGQADVLHPRGTEILESLDLGTQVMAGENRAYYFTTYKDSPNGDIVRVSRRDGRAGVESRFRYLLVNAQSTIEGVFRDAMGSGDKIIRGLTFTPDVELIVPRKVAVEHNIRPTRLSVSDDLTTLSDSTSYPATVILEHSNGESETVQAKYVLGCDGAHSWTRTQLGINMVGDTSDDVWGVIDCYVDSDFPDLRTLSVIEKNGRLCALIPREHNMVRFTVQINHCDVGVDPLTGRTDRTQVKVEKIQQLVKQAFSQYRVDFVGEPDWWSVYVVGQRLASSYGDTSARVFIVGDACHTHSPHAGQGMNAALTDAHNLSWKLVHVLKGWAKCNLLHTYEVERRGFAKELVHVHQQIADFTSGKAPRNSGDIFLKISAFTSGVGVRYPESQIVDTTHQNLAPKIPIGQRFPHQIILRTADCRPYSTHDLIKSDFKYKLLVFTGNATDPEQYKVIEKFSKDMSKWLDESKLRAMVQVYTIMHSKKENSEYTTIPAALRSAWDTVFMDDEGLAKVDGGGAAYENMGVEKGGCVAVVRPDGHTAGIVRLGEMEDLRRLFCKLIS